MRFADVRCEDVLSKLLFLEEPYPQALAGKKRQLKNAILKETRMRNGLKMQTKTSNQSRDQLEKHDVRKPMQKHRFKKQNK